MTRRDLIKLGAIAAASASAATPPGDPEELTDIQRGYSARSLTENCLSRIESLNHRSAAINAVIEINPDALKTAGELDRERQTKGPRSPLHGIPVLIKDNIDVAGPMLTSGGSLALVDAPAPKDAPLVARLRAAGAVILGKTNLSEWANFRGQHSTSGWSARGGQTKNPYALDRNPSGSSSGSAAAVAAAMCPVAIGTETDGSIVSPSSICGLVGIKPTVGLVSRTGIIPISASQDTAGPMARTVRDAVLLLNVVAEPKTPTDYTKSLDAAGLRGARLGIVRNRFGFQAGVDKLMDEMIAAMKSHGAEIIDPVEIPPDAKISEPEMDVLLFELKAGLNAYFKARGRPKYMGNDALESLIAFNRKNASRELKYFGQELFEQSQKKGPLTDPAYLKARAECIRLTRTEGIDAATAKHKLTVLRCSHLLSCLAYRLHQRRQCQRRLFDRARSCGISAHHRARGPRGRTSGRHLFLRSRVVRTGSD